MDQGKALLIKYWEDNGLLNDKNLLTAFKSVKRENFVLKENVDQAYYDIPLHIGHGQTISQPTTVIIMLRELELKKTDKVLEIGTGSGYNCAIIAEIVKKIITIETNPQLVDLAKEKLTNSKIQIILGDGSIGYKQQAPYDKIIVTAACPQIPMPLLNQLKDNGILIAPVGDLHSQDMIKVIKNNNKFKEKNLGSFRFVPLKGKHGF